VLVLVSSICLVLVSASLPVSVSLITLPRPLPITILIILQICPSHRPLFTPHPYPHPTPPNPTHPSTADRLHADPYLASSLLQTLKRSRFLHSLNPPPEEVRACVRACVCVFISQ
jgi:hypothetical protein